MSEESEGDDSDDGVGRNRYDHSKRTSQMACDEQDDEYFKRSCFDAGRVDQRLVYEVVNQLGEA